MSRYRLHPTPAQQAVLRDHCGHARYVWNLAVEQHSHWRPGRKGAPGYLEQCRPGGPVLATDFLPRIVEPGIVTDVSTNGRKFFEVPASYGDPGCTARRRCRGTGWPTSASCTTSPRRAGTT